MRRDGDCNSSPGLSLMGGVSTTYWELWVIAVSGRAHRTIAIGSSGIDSVVVRRPCDKIAHYLNVRMAPLMQPLVGHIVLESR